MDKVNTDVAGQTRQLSEPTPGVYDAHVAGLKFRKGATARWEQVKEGDRLILEPEPDNKFDPNAVKVLIPIDGFHLGYVPKYLAPRVFSACMVKTHRVTCIASFGKMKITIVEEEK